MGNRKAAELAPSDVARLHSKMSDTPYQANRMLAVLSNVYGFAGRMGLVARGTNPAIDLDRYREQSRERFLTNDELARLGEAIREAETIGIAWQVDHTKPTDKHTPKARPRTIIDPYAAAAIPLLLLTGCRLREILHLRWNEVDFDRGLLLLGDPTTGKKAVVLNAPALALFREIRRIGRYVIAIASTGAEDEKPRPNLKKPWAAVSKRAGLDGVRLHDLQHTHATYACLDWCWRRPRAANHRQVARTHTSKHAPALRTSRR